MKFYKLIITLMGVSLLLFINGCPVENEIGFEYFISNPIPQSSDRRQYLGGVEVFATNWYYKDIPSSEFGHVQVDQLRDNDPRFLPGNWYDITLFFTEGLPWTPSVDFDFKVGGPLTPREY